MDIRKRLGRALLLLGMVLLTGSAFSAVSYHTQRQYAEKKREELLETFKQMIPERVQGTVAEEPCAALEIEGISCVGMFCVPELGIETVVGATEIDGEYIPFISRKSGESQTDDGEYRIVLEDAREYGLFHRVDSRYHGMEAVFTDAYGREYHYKITEVEEENKDNQSPPSVILEPPIFSTPSISSVPRSRENTIRSA